MSSLKPTNLAEDPNVKIPAAVRAGAAQANQIHQQAYQTEPPAPEEPAAPLTPEPVAATLTEPPAPQPGEPGYDDSWKHRYDAMKGRHDKLQTENTQLHDRMSRMEAMLAQMQAAPPAPQPPAPELNPASLVTPDEISQYGDEFMDVVARRAREAVRPELAARDARIQELEQQLTGTAAAVAGTARERLISTLDERLPDWRVLNTKPEFLNWLRLSDPYSGAIRQALLTSAFDRNDSHRVLAFFEGYLSEEAAVAPAAPNPALPAHTPERPRLENFAAPGRAKSAPSNPGAPAEKPFISRAQISSFYADVAAGRYVGKEAEKKRLEDMIFDAQNSGRIRG